MHYWAVVLIALLTSVLPVQGFTGYWPDDDEVLDRYVEMAHRHRVRSSFQANAQQPIEEPVQDNAQQPTEESYQDSAQQRVEEPAEDMWLDQTSSLKSPAFDSPLESEPAQDMWFDQTTSPKPPVFHSPLKSEPAQDSWLDGIKSQKPSASDSSFQTEPAQDSWLDGIKSPTPPATFDATPKPGAKPENTTAEDDQQLESSDHRVVRVVQARQHNHPGDDYTNPNTIPGKPGIDYPTHSHVPLTKFYCYNQKQPGYYADPEAGCQVFHVCNTDGRQDSFLCPPGTIFNQPFFVCDWWFNVDCQRATKFYSLNSNMHRAMADTSKGATVSAQPVVDRSHRHFHHHREKSL